MVDVVICCSEEDHAAARQLEEAILRAGYSVWWNDGPADFWHSDAVIEKIGEAKAAIAIWSNASRASGLFHAEAGAARAQKKLIQVSADGREPPVPFDQVDFGSIGDWSDITGHPAWRHISDELQSICGTLPTGPQREQRERRGSRFKLLAVLIPAGVAAAALALTGDRDGRADRPPIAEAPATPRLAELDATPPSTAKAVSPGPPQVISSPRLQPGQQLAAATSDTHLSPEFSSPAKVRPEFGAQPRTDANARAERANAEPENREMRGSKRAKRDAPAKQNADRRKATAQRQVARPRVRYKYSENMRQFCQKAGRGTRECRIFRRNGRNAVSRPQTARAAAPIYGPPS